jgi:hypothetical protein
MMPQMFVEISETPRNMLPFSRLDREGGRMDGRKEGRTCNHILEALMEQEAAKSSSAGNPKKTAIQ